MRIRCQWFPKDDPCLSFAAQELEDYLSRMLPDAGELDISLRVEDDERDLERFQIRLTPGEGEIIGNSPCAALLAAYDLLRRLGCRFLAPGRANEIVPVIRAEALRLQYAHEARFAHRGVCIEGADRRENVLDFIDWLPKMGYNAFFFQFQVPWAFYARWYQHRRNPRRPPEAFTMSDARRLMDEAEGEIKRRGLLLHKVGHGWTAAVLGREATSWDVETPLSDEIRPLAAMVDGRRELFRGVPLNTNLCLSNPDAVERFVELVANYAKAHPEADYLHIWLADECNNVCECDACRRTTPSDQYVALLNAIDARLSREGLATRLVFLLYQELLWPPTRERLRNPERFALMFAPISRSFERSYAAGEDGGRLPPYVRNRIALPTDLAENLRFLRAWRGIFDGDGFAYDYPLGRAHYGDFGYLHIARVIFEDVGELRALGLNGYMSCQELRAGMPNFLPNYVMGRALMDADAGFDEIVEEYFRALYGEGWREARDFLAALSECQVCDYLNGKGPRTNQRVARKLARAEMLCQGFKTKGSGKAWERLEWHARYVLLLARALRGLAECDLPRSRRAYGRFLEYVRESEEKVQPWLDGYRVGEVTGKYGGLKE